MHTVTSTEQLNEKDLNLIQNILWCARVKWNNIGLALKIDPSTLEVIKRDNHCNTDECFKEMLLKWLRRADPVPCWKALAVALNYPSVGITVAEDSIGMYHISFSMYQTLCLY